MDSVAEQPLAMTAAAGGPPIDAQHHDAQRGRGMRFSYPSGAKPLAGYTIKRGIGIGGFGEVYFALSDAGKEVALKRIQRNVDVELRGVSQCLNLKHGNLITLWDIRQDDHGEGWVVMEYVPGPNLREVLNEHPNGLPLDEALRWFVSISKGVAYLHDHGIVHRDLKPGNIFYDEDEQVVKIGDYGLSKFISCSQRSGQTESVGTFHYMAPEIGKGAYGREIDIYALGIILYELLTGRVPYDGESSQEIIMKHLMAEPDVTGVDDPFCRVVKRSLAKSPEHRFPSAQQMLGGLIDEALIPVMQPFWPTSQGFPPLRPAIELDAQDASQAAKTKNDEASDDQTKDKPNAELTPLFIREDLLVIEDQVDDGIFLGEVRHKASDPSIPPQRETTVAATRPATTYEASIPSRSSTNHSHRSVIGSNRPGSSDEEEGLSFSEMEFREPIAHSVVGFFQRLGRTWNHSRISLPIKIVVVIAASVVVLLNAQWLLPLAAILVGTYALYYIGLSLWRYRIWRQAKHDTPAAKREREQARLKMLAQEEQWRAKLRRRPWSEVASSLIGSLLMTVLVVASISGLAVSALLHQFDTLGDSLSFYAWFGITTCLTCSWILVSGKCWERSIGDTLHRRLWMVAAGVGVGFSSYALAAFLRLEPPEVRLLESPPLIENLTGGEETTFLFSIMLFSTGLLVSMRWWRQTDAIRKIRLSLFAIGRAILIAIVMALVLPIPLIWAILGAGLVSFTIQIAAPHWKEEERDLVPAELVAVDAADVTTVGS